MIIMKVVKNYARILILRWIFAPVIVVFCGLMLFFAVAAIGCGRGGSANEAAEETAGGDSFRIVCLSPAVTDILIDLGVGEFIVGRDAWDEQLGAEVPRVGDLTNLDAEALIRLRPSDVVLQAGRRGVPAGFDSLATEYGWKVLNVQIDSLGDILGVVDTLANELSFGGDDEFRARALKKAEELRGDFEAAMEPIEGWSGGGDESGDGVGEREVLLLYEVDPPSAFGPGSYLGDVLLKMGVVNSLGEGGAWRELDAEALVHLDPWAIVLIRDGAIEESGARADVGRLVKLPLRAIREGRCYQVSHPQALLPGTCVIEVVRQLRSVLELMRAVGGMSKDDEGDSN